MKKFKFPDLVAAVKKRDNVQWEVGDLTIKHAGDPEEEKYHDGSRATLKEIAEELAAAGYPEYTTSRLAELRIIAYKFPIARRAGDLPWGYSQDARSPEMLEACLALLKEKKIALTRDNSRWARQEIERQEEEERQKAFDKATEDKAAAKEEEKQAKAKLREAEDAKAREKAQRELEEAEARKRKAEEEERKNKAPPKKGSKRKKKKDPVPMGILEHDISANACQAAGLAEKTLKLLKGREKELKQLSPVALASLMEDMLSAVNLWRELVDKISAATPNKRGHLAAVPNAAE